MEALELILNFITELQNDESVDLSNYSSQFVAVTEAHDMLATALQEGEATNETNSGLINELKSENWELSKKITTKDTPEAVETPAEDEAGDENKETEYENTDEAIDDLFKKEDKEEKGE